jgi:hypothetical protein
LQLKPLLFFAESAVELVKFIAESMHELQGWLCSFEKDERGRFSVIETFEHFVIIV